MSEHLIFVQKHRTWNFYAKIKEGTGVADIDGFQFTFTAKRDIKDKKKIFSQEMIVNVLDGSISLSLDTEDTARLPLGNHVYDIKMVKSNGEVVTLLKGGFNVERVVGE